MTALQQEHYDVWCNYLNYISQELQQKDDARVLNALKLLNRLIPDMWYVLYDNFNDALDTKPIFWRHFKSTSTLMAQYKEKLLLCINELCAILENEKIIRQPKSFCNCPLLQTVEILKKLNCDTESIFKILNKLLTKNVYKCRQPISISDGDMTITIMFYSDNTIVEDPDVRNAANLCAAII